MAAPAQGRATAPALAGTLAMLLSACSAKQETTPAAAPAVAPAPAAPQSTAPITHSGRGLRGQAVLGKDGYGIVPCGESAQRIMEISPSAKPFLDKYLAGGAHEFFVEAEGRDLDNGHVFVTRFHRLYSEGPGCKAQLDPTAFVAWGNEPFWAATDAGGTLRFERPARKPCSPSAAKCARRRASGSSRAKPAPACSACAWRPASAATACPTPCMPGRRPRASRTRNSKAAASRASNASP
jgi:hypothetical protein